MKGFMNKKLKEKTDPSLPSQHNYTRTAHIIIVAQLNLAAACRLHRPRQSDSAPGPSQPKVGWKELLPTVEELRRACLEPTPAKKASQPRARAYLWRSTARYSRFHRVRHQWHQRAAIFFSSWFFFSFRSALAVLDAHAQCGYYREADE